ncbi:hypothetical protein BJX68DRAFT_53204 [Aspergillus pseudodeflectus]|uniref:Uncharacterized protein n=1 Tax=Aspergillus pseudodeflectus TaxID=176178 RepID=A0ABR4J6Z0_9EURO
MTRKQGRTMPLICVDPNTSMPTIWLTSTPLTLVYQARTWWTGRTACISNSVCCVASLNSHDCRVPQPFQACSSSEGPIAARFSVFFFLFFLGAWPVNRWGTRTNTL